MSEDGKRTYIKMESCFGGETHWRETGRAVIKRRSRLRRLGEEAIAYKTLKHDGSHLTFDFDQKEMLVASRNIGFLDTKEKYEGFHREVLNDPFMVLVKQKVTDLCKKFDGRIIVRGEVFGSRIGVIHTIYKKRLDFNVFEVVVDGSVMDYPEMKRFCNSVLLDVVPLLDKGFALDMHEAKPKAIEHQSVIGFAEGSMLTVYSGTPQKATRFKQRRKGAIQQHNAVSAEKSHSGELLVPIDALVINSVSVANVFSHNSIPKPTRESEMKVYVHNFMIDIFLSGDIDGSDSWTPEEIDIFKSQTLSYVPLFIKKLL